MSKRAALYIRVSSDEQARHGLSLGEQRAELTQYVQERGYTIVDVYADEGLTARKAISRRKELQRLLRDVRAGHIDIIVMKCLDRWFRNIRDYYHVQEILDEYGVLWECSQEEFNTTTANGRFWLHMKLSIAQHESDQTGERIRYVFEGKKKRHEVLTGIMPLGYKVVNKHAEPDENAPIVQFMFDYVASGGSARSVMKAILDKFGIAITYRQVYHTLRSKAYIGELHGVPNYCPALVPYDVFHKVQEIVSKNKKAAPSGRIYLFTGLLRCPGCGRIMAGNKGRTNVQGVYYRFQYRCNSRVTNMHVDRCNFKRAIFEDKIEDFLLDNLQRLLADHIHDIELSRSKQTGENAAAKLEEINSRILRLKDIYLDGMIDKDVYEKDYVELRRKADELSVQINKAPSITPAVWQTVEAGDFKETYESLSRENKRRFWQSIISSLTFEDTPESRGRGGKYVFHVTFL